MVSLRWPVRCPTSSSKRRTETHPQAPRGTFPGQGLQAPKWLEPQSRCPGVPLWGNLLSAPGSTPQAAHPGACWQCEARAGQGTRNPGTVLGGELQGACARGTLASKRELQALAYTATRQAPRGC